MRKFPVAAHIGSRLNDHERKDNMNNVKKKSILWDNDAEQEATNYDGTDPVIDGDYVYMKELGCNCNPANGAGCGGCVERTEEHKIGTRFVWRKSEIAKP